MDENQEYIYTYDKEELKEYLDKWYKGISFMMNPTLEADLKMYQLEQESEIMDNSDEIADFVRSKGELMKKKLEAEKRKATKHDIVIIQLTDAQKRQLEEDMSESIVRRNPDLLYHKRDDELYETAEKKEIYQKLNRLQKAYYNQADYVSAINIIMQAIQYSLKHDYPWMSYEEALKEFNRGHIRFEYCQLPKLYLNWTTIIDDPDTLKGVINGTVTIIQKDDDSRKRKKKEEPIGQRYEIDITGVNEWNYLYGLHQQGYNTPISPIIRAAQGTFSRFSLPDTNWFYQQKEQQQHAPIEYDWMQENAGENYYNLVHNVKYTLSDLMDDLQYANNNNLNQNIQYSADEFLTGLKYVDQPQNGSHTYKSNMVVSQDQKTLAMEQSILQAMRNANPNN